MVRFGFGSDVTQAFYARARPVGLNAIYSHSRHAQVSPRDAIEIMLQQVSFSTRAYFSDPQAARIYLKNSRPEPTGRESRRTIKYVTETERTSSREKH